MDKEILEQFQMLAGMMGQMQISIEDNKKEILKTQGMIENSVSKKISSLFDGYKLTHEKQFELERRVEKLENIILELQSRIA